MTVSMKGGGTVNGDRLSAARAAKPVGLQPRVLGRQGLAAIQKRPQNAAADRRHISPPASLLVGLDVRGPRDGGAAQCREVDFLAINAPDNPAGFDDKLHGSARHRGRRRMFRLGRSTKQAIQYALHAGHFRGDVLPQAGIVAQVLRLDTADDLLGVGHQTVQLLVAADVKLAEPLEELGQVLDYAIAEDFGLPIVLAREPLGEVTTAAWPTRR